MALCFLCSRARAIIAGQLCRKQGDRSHEGWLPARLIE